MSKRSQSSLSHRSEFHKRLTDILKSVGQRHGLFQVFRDSVEIWALSLSNTVDGAQFQAREAAYLRIVSRYNKEELTRIAEGLACVMMALQGRFQDFLGSIFMGLELGNAWAGQFFTPYEVSQLMAALNFGAIDQEAIKTKGYISVNDPCTGGGAMLIAVAEAMANQGLDYTQQLYVVAQDIDPVAVHMTYVQLSALGVPATVILGNSLAVEARERWHTPAVFHGNWFRRLQEERAQPVPTQTLAIPAPSPAPEQGEAKLGAQLVLFNEEAA